MGASHISPGHLRCRDNEEIGTIYCPHPPAPSPGKGGWGMGLNSLKIPPPLPIGHGRIKRPLLGAEEVSVMFDDVFAEYLFSKWATLK